MKRFLKEENGRIYLTPAFEGALLLAIEAYELWNNGFDDKETNFHNCQIDFLVDAYATLAAPKLKS